MATTEQTVRTATLAVPGSRKIVGGILTVGVPLAVWFLPLPLEANAKHALAVASFMIIAWITEVMPHALTGMAGCYLFWALKIVSFETAFSGFADQTPWFLFGAALIGMMATKSGLARRLAYLVMRRVGAGYSRLLLGIILSSFLLTLLVPSGIACVVIMAAVALGLIEVFGLPRGSNVGRGIFVTLTYTAGIYDKMVIAGATSILARGLIEKTTGIEVYWSQWLLAFLPCVVVTMFVIWRLVLWLYPPEKAALEGGVQFLDESLQKMGPWTQHGETRAVFDVVRYRALGYGLDSPYLSRCDRHRGWPAGGRARSRHPGPGRPKAAELSARVFHGGSNQHGRSAAQNECAELDDDGHVRVDAAVGDKYIFFGAGAVLDGVRLSHLFGERTLDAGDLRAAFDEFRESGGNSSAAARFALVIRGRRQDFCVSVWGAGYRLFLWLL